METVEDREKRKKAQQTGEDRQEGLGEKRRQTNWKLEPAHSSPPAEVLGS